MGEQVPLLKKTERRDHPSVSQSSEFLSTPPPEKSLLLLFAPRPMFVQQANCICEAVEAFVLYVSQGQQGCLFQSLSEGRGGLEPHPM